MKTLYRLQPDPAIMQVCFLQQIPSRRVKARLCSMPLPAEARVYQAQPQGICKSCLTLIWRLSGHIKV